ncbi:hypothetical protein ACOSQ4_032114 [Xanthoceras sorbifolium]
MGLGAGTGVQGRKGVGTGEQGRRRGAGAQGSRGWARRGAGAGRRGCANELVLYDLGCCGVGEQGWRGAAMRGRKKK